MATHRPVRLAHYGPVALLGHGRRAESGCTSAPVGRGPSLHTWRQRFPDGPAEQTTSGLTEEEGIAMAADGRSFVTAVALRQSIVYVHDSSGDRQVSLEGYSYDPKLTPDGKRLCYRILKTAGSWHGAGELRVV